MPHSVLQWACKNKLVVLLGLLSFCLLVSTIVLSLEKSKCVKRGSFSSKDLPKNKKHDPAKDEKTMDYYRLPRHILPKNYKLILSPNMTSNTFEGVVTITLRVFEPVEKITLHSNKLNIQTISLRNFNNAIVPVKSVNITSDNREMLHIYFKQKITQEYYKLDIKFEGQLINKIIGLYSSRLKNNR